MREEIINANFVEFIQKLEKYNAYPDAMKNDEEFLTKLRFSSAFISEDSGWAYEGSLIEHTKRVAVIAFNINKLLSADLQVPLDSLIKVCYLHQIGKPLMIQKNEVEWEIKKGRLFAFRRDIPAIKCAEYSVMLCNKYGVNLSEEEFEAILSTDKVSDDQTKYFGNMLSHILNCAIDIANTEGRLKQKLRANGSKKD